MTAAAGVLPAVLASLPSPGSGVLEIGPLSLRAYGLMIAAGVVAAVWLAGKRFAARGYDPELATSLAMWAVPAGLVGARAYHVITDWQRFEDEPLDIFKIWEGGLGILGGVLAGLAVGVWWMRRHTIPVADGLDIVAPAVPLAQAIGRWGNWFNQELFGRPTDLPWGLEIDPENRPDAYADSTTFHPTFLYESLWNLGLMFFLIWLDRKRVLGPGRLFAAYLAGYSLGRLWVEAIRIDTATEVAGLRVNLWVFGMVLVVSLAIALTGRRRIVGEEVPGEALDVDDSGHRGDDQDDDEDDAGLDAEGDGAPDARADDRLEDDPTDVAERPSSGSRAEGT